MGLVTCDGDLAFLAEAVRLEIEAGGEAQVTLTLLEELFAPKVQRGCCLKDLIDVWGRKHGWEITVDLAAGRATVRPA